MADEMLQWGVATQLHQGENLSGDQHYVHAMGSKLLVAAIDGVGHGAEAAAASRAAVLVLADNPAQSLIDLCTTCHQALAGTRGVVMTLAIMDSAEEILSWVGIGNVEGRLMRADITSSQPEETLLPRSGVVGHNMPATLNISTLQIFKGDVLIMATDGIRSDFANKLSIGRSAHEIANDILARHNKGIDDALVVVAKFRGGVSSQA